MSWCCRWTRRPRCSHDRVARQPRPAQPQHVPNRLEHEYQRAGALHLVAAFDTRAGKVYGHGHERKRQREFIAFLDALEAEIAYTSTRFIWCAIMSVRIMVKKSENGWCNTRALSFTSHLSTAHG